MPNRVETVPVLYPAQVVTSGGRKEYPAFLVAEVAVAIPTGPAPEMVAEIRLDGLMPPQTSLPTRMSLGWTGEPWRYYEHPQSGGLLTEWRPAVWEDLDHGGRYTQRSTVGLESLFDHLSSSMVDDLSIAEKNVAMGPAYNPFVERIAWTSALTEDRRLVLPESMEMRRSQVVPGVRDSAIASATRLARSFFATEDGRLLVPTDAPRWFISGLRNHGMMMPWPGALQIGVNTAVPHDYFHSTITGCRPDLAEAFNPYGSQMRRFGSLTIADGVRLEPGQPLQRLEAEVQRLTGYSNTEWLHEEIDRASPPLEDRVVMREALDRMNAGYTGLLEWLASPQKDPALLIDPLAMTGHGVSGFAQAVDNCTVWSGDTSDQQRCAAEESLKYQATHHSVVITPKLDRTLRIVGALTGIGVPARCTDLQQPEMIAASPTQSPVLQGPR